MPRSRVDVIVPCYNYGRYLRDCLASIGSQGGVDLRVLILDDASTDETPRVAAELAANDPRIAWRRHDRNRGHIATYNEGIDWASGDYLLLISADDLLTPGALGRAATLLDGHPEVGLVYGEQVVFRSEPPALVPNPSIGSGASIQPGWAFLDDLCATGSNPVPTPSVVVRTRIQKAIGGYRPDLPHTADLYNWLAVASRSSVARLDAYQAYKRIHDTNMQHAFTSADLLDLTERLNAFTSFLKAAHAPLDAPGRLERSARRAVASQAFWAAVAAFDRGDEAACQPLLDFCLANDPGLRNTRPWARLQWKRRMGPRVWGALRPVVAALGERTSSRT